jgi:hypothetical protein
MQLADLAARIAANDAVIERINRKLPKDATWIAGAELVARKLRNFNDCKKKRPLKDFGPIRASGQSRKSLPFNSVRVHPAN